MAIQQEDLVTKDDPFASIEDRPAGASSNLIVQGWDDPYKSQPKKDYVEDFKVTEDSQFIRFIADVPPLRYLEHFLTVPGRRSYTCLKDNCPACNAGSVATPKRLFSVALVTKDGAVLQKLSCRVKLFNKLTMINSDKRQGPLNGVTRNGVFTPSYWEIKKTGQGLGTDYHMSLYTGEELTEEGFNISKIESDIAGMQPLDSSVIRVDTFEVLQKILNENPQPSDK
jgi:hypothetical protein